jgi:hypothetical protein
MVRNGDAGWVGKRSRLEVAGRGRVGGWEEKKAEECRVNV